MSLPVAPQYVGITPLSAHIRRAVEFSQKSDVYVVIGRQTTPWPDEANPPVPTVDTEVVEEPLGYSKATMKLLVPDTTGTIEIYNLNWRHVTQANAYADKARHVWVTAQFRYNEVDPTASYRVVGIVSGLQRDPADQTANPGKTILLPADVVSPGQLEYVYNDRPIPRAINRRDVLNAIITF